MENLQQQINNLQAQLDALTNNTTIPKEIGDAFTARLNEGIVSAKASSVTVGSKTQSVNESGSSSYSVAKPMTAIVAVKIGNTTYNLADYS